MAEAKQIILFAKKIKLVDKITFIQNLGIMIRSGIPIIDALSVVKEDVENPALSDLIKNLSASLEKGETIHTALRKNPDFLNEAHMGILEAGEVSGQLYESLERIKIDLQKENDLFQKIKGALTYPAVIFMSLIGIGGGIIVVVLPKIAEVFARMGVKKLPITTRVMVAVGTFVSKNLPLSAGVCAVFITVSLLFVASKGGRKILGNLISSIPLVNGLVADMNYTRFSRTLSALVKSGVNIDQSLEISSRVFSEKTKKIMNDEIIKKVRKGELISASMKDYKKLFPGIMVRMISVGESSGNLSEVLADLADYFDKRVDSKLTVLTNMMEPVLMLIVGLSIGAAVLSIMAPIYTMIGSMQESQF